MYRSECFTQLSALLAAFKFFVFEMFCVFNEITFFIFPLKGLVGETDSESQGAGGRGGCGDAPCFGETL